MKGISKKIVESISKSKGEPKWMREFRVNSYLKFEEMLNPIFGPFLDIDFNDITYYKKVGDKVENSWDDVPKDVRDTFDTLMYEADAALEMKHYSVNKDTEKFLEKVLYEVMGRGLLLF